MRGLMSERPLLISGILQHAANFHADTEIVSRLVDGSIHRYTYADADRKSTRLNSSHTVISYAVFCLKKKKTSSYLTDQLRLAVPPVRYRYRLLREQINAHAGDL